MYLIVLLWLQDPYMTLEDAFPLQKMIQLEETDEAIITEMTQMEIHNGRIYILEQNQNLVFTYDLEGKYLGILGNKGQGPGEYTLPTRLFHGPENAIGLVDAGNSRLTFYDQKGSYLKEFSRRDAGYFHATDALFHNDAFYFFQIALSKNGCEEGFNAISRLRDGKLMFDTCFGKSSEHEFDKKFGTLPIRTIKRLDDDGIWAFYPYENKLNLFDFNGNLSKEISFRDPNHFQQEDLMKMKSYKDFISKRNDKNLTTDLIPLKDHILLKKTAKFGEKRILTWWILDKKDGRFIFEKRRPYNGDPLLYQDNKVYSLFGIVDDEYAIPYQKNGYPDEFAYMASHEMDVSPGAKFIRAGTCTW